MIAALCHPLVLVHCGLASPKSAQLSTRKSSQHFTPPSADKLYWDANFIFQQDLAPAHTAQSMNTRFNDRGITVLDWPANLPDLLSRGRWEIRPNNAEELKAAVKATWPSILPQQRHRLIASKPHFNDPVIPAKVDPTNYWVHVLSSTFYCIFTIIFCFNLVPSWRLFYPDYVTLVMNRYGEDERARLSFLNRELGPLVCLWSIICEITCVWLLSVSQCLLLLPRLYFQ